jgi:hypothetical protein
MGLFLVEKTFKEKSVGEAYRYEEHAVYYDRSYSPEYDDPDMRYSHMEVRLHTFHIKKFTPKGFWIFGVIRDRFVLNGAKKRYAWLTKIDAMKSFIARKEAHASFAAQRLARVTDSLKVGQKMLAKLELEKAEEEAKHGIPIQYAASELDLIPKETQDASKDRLQEGPKPQAV